MTAEYLDWSGQKPERRTADVCHAMCKYRRELDDAMTAERERKEHIASTSPALLSLCSRVLFGAEDVLPWSPPPRRMFHVVVDIVVVRGG
jgi:hypothetical protein